MSIFCHFNKIIHIQNQSSKFKFLNFFLYPTPFSFRSIQRFGFHPEHLVTIPDQPLTNLVKQFINSLTNQSLMTSWIGQLVRLIKFWTAFQSSFFVKGVGFHLNSKDTYCYRKIRILFTQVQPTMNLLDFRNVLAYIYAIFRFSEL